MERSKWITVFLISLLLFSLLFCVVIFDFNSSNGEILDNYSISERNQVSLLDSAESLTSIDSSNDKILFFDTRSSYNDFIQNEEFETAYYNLKAIRTKSLDFTRNYEMTVFPDVYNKLELHQSSEVRSFYGVDDLLNIQEIWDMGYFGNNITVGVLDNGIKTDLSSFENQVAHTEFMGIPSIAPCYNHGTPVSGIIAGDENPSNLPIGIAKDASLVDIQFSCNGATIEGDFLGAFEYVLSQNDTIDIINTSFGGFAPTWDPIIRQLESVGIITVGSAGNSGPSSHSTTTGGPGNSVHAISVGSINSNLGVSTFSSSGPAHYMTQKPDLLAPGESIASISHNGGSGSFTGTSFSSPIVAGSIAVLLSALQAQNITYNPGLIKSSLLESATPVEGDQLRTGAGIPNILDAFNLIQNNSELVSLAPNSAPLSYLQSVPRGQIIKIPISLISSNPLTTTLDFSGDLNGITISYNISNDYSQQVILEIDTTQFSSNIDVTGSLTANVGGYSSSIDLSFHITEDAVGTLGIDLTHTFWDQFGANHIGGSNIGKMIELAMTNGIKVVEISDPLTDVILQDLDILWMPDPLNIIDPSNSYSTDYLFEEQPLSTDEINNLLDFVNNGKDLVISSLGLQYPERTQTSRLSGTNATAVNMLTGNFGIELSDDPLYLGSSNSKSLILNQSSLVKGVDEITHIGNYLSIDETKAWVLAQENGRPTLAYNQNSLTSGKVVVSSTNLWMDNIGLITQYGQNVENIQLANNLWNWLMTDQDIVKLSQSVSSDRIYGSFETDNLDPNEIEILFEENGVDSLENLDISNNGNIYNISAPLNTEGIFRMVTSYGEEYIAWELIRDLSAPVWTISEDNLNNSNFSNDSFIVLKFDLYDEYSGLNISSFTQELDGQTSEFVYFFSENSQELQLIINPFNLESNRLYTLSLSISDNSGNTGELNYMFYINRVSQTPSNPSSSNSDDSLLNTNFIEFISVFFTINIICRYRKASSQRI